MQEQTRLQSLRFLQARRTDAHSNPDLDRYSICGCISDSRSQGIVIHPSKRTDSTCECPSRFDLICIEAFYSISIVGQVPPIPSPLSQQQVACLLRRVGNRLQRLPHPRPRTTHRIHRGPSRASIRDHQDHSIGQNLHLINLQSLLLLPLLPLSPSYQALPLLHRQPRSRTSTPSMISHIHN